MKFLFGPFKKGFEHALGELENDIMQFIWDKNDAVSAKMVIENVITKRSIALTTVFTILDRLTDKGILLKKKVGKSIFNKTKLTRVQYIEEVTKKHYKKEFSKENVISCFVDIISNTNDSDKIKQLISERSCNR